MAQQFSKFQEPTWVERGPVQPFSKHYSVHRAEPFLMLSCFVEWQGYCHGDPNKKDITMETVLGPKSLPQAIHRS